jgi:hypothetical protein
MPQFTLDLQFTEEGLKNFQSPGQEKFHQIRDHATAVAQGKIKTRKGRNLNLKVISRIDRPVGPQWVVEGQLSDVEALVEQFNNPDPPNPPTVRARIE